MEDLIGKEFLEVIGDLAGQICPVIVHCEEDSLDGQGMAERVLDSVDGGDKFRDPFQGEEFALNRDENAVGGGKGVDGEEVEGGGAVDENVVVMLAAQRQGGPKFVLAFRKVDEIDVGCSEILVGRQDGKALKRRWKDGLIGGN